MAAPERPTAPAATVAVAVAVTDGVRGEVMEESDDDDDDDDGASKGSTPSGGCER